jgi:GT2 family glycosyltransferase/Flp pilus assembly protein TadD
MLAIIFSKDRPLQLDATLRSFMRHCLDFHRISVRIIVKASSEIYGQAYQSLEKEYASYANISLIAETDFRQQVLHLLRSDEYILWLVDDDIFVRNFTLADCQQLLEVNQDVLGYSLRLGENTTYCYMLDKPQALPPFNKITDTTYSYYWSNAECDFGYPLEVASSLYRTCDLSPLLESINFFNPNSLEGKMAAHAAYFNTTLPRLLCPIKSITFSTPINKVHTTAAENRAGNSALLSSDALLDNFLKGKRIDVATFDGFTPNACHQEVAFTFIDSENVCPKVSVIIPCYNYGRYLTEAVSSVIGQTFQDFEIIIVNDGSTDNSREVAEKLIAENPRHRIRLINQENSGQPAISRNNAIRVSQGRYIICLDADDMIATNMIEECLVLLESHPEIAIAYTDRLDFDGFEGVVQAGEYDFSRLIYANHISYCALYRKEVWERVGGYRDNVKAVEDWDFWIASGALGYYGKRIPLPLFKYRRHNAGIFQDALKDFGRKHAQIIINNPALYDPALIAQAEKLLGSTVNVSSCPLVTVIVPTYNRPHMLINALKSIFGQTYQSYEVIVVNDGGSDVRDLFEGLPSDSIRYLQHETNRGLPAARNTGIKAARGKYIAYLDDDDLFYPDHLETLVYFLESAEHVVAYTDAHRTFQERQNGKYVTSKKDVPYSINFDYELILKENFIPVLCIMHRKSCVESVGLFDETLQSHEDWDLWMRMSRRFRFAHIPVVTCSFSWRQDGSTMTSGGPQKMHESRVIVSQRGKEYQRTGMIHPDTMERSGYASIDYPAIRELLHSQRKEQAFAELQEYLAKFPNHAEAHRDLGSLYCEKGEKGKALHHYEKAVALDPKNIIALRSLADFYYVEMKKIDEAVCLYKKILSIKPEDVDALCVLGNLSIERQAFDSARQYYLQALLIDPTNEPAGTMMDALDSKGLGSAAESPDIALLEARRLVRKGETGRAIIKLETLIRLHPKEAGAHNDLGNLYCLQNEIEKALFHLDRAVQLQPDVLRLVKDLADAHLAEAANVSEALQLFIRALALKPDDVDTLLRIGNLCAVQQQFDDAQFFYNRVLSIEPGNAQAGENLAVLQRMSEGKPSIRQSPDGDSTVQEKGNHGERVSIVILTFNKLDYTKKCVESIRRHTPEHHEIIFVDNGSTAETVQWLQKLVRENGHYKLIENKTNLGFAKGCNQGAHVASGNYLLFLNNDTEPQAGWLEPLVNVLERDPSVAAVGSRLLFPDGTIQHAGVLILDDRKLPDPLVARHIYYGHASDMAEANQAKVYQALTGACILVRREAFNQVEGFDEEYWNGYEDIDFCFKLQEKECIIVYQPASVLIHHESKSGTERFTKTHENIKRLHIKWIGKIKPDAIIENNGTLRWNRLPHNRSYFAPTDYKEELQRNSSHNKNNLVSIVILACNQQKFTKECVESIQKHTPEPHEIIFVDNGSSDGTVKWLKKIIKNNSNYKMIENKKNLGFSRGCNQGIEAARGERILLLNNDVVVTENWLTGMLECLNSAPDIGIVGPMTNSISGLQKVPVVGYASIDGLAEYALAFRQKNRHRRIPCRRIVGFCMLFNRRLLEEVGLLDESFGSGNFEDDDFCLRAYLKGYRNLIAGDVFIHHYGSRTFIGNRIDYGSSLTGNREIYASKWRAIEQEAEQGRKIRALVAREQGGERLQRGDVKGAVDLYLAAIRQCPDDPHAYRDLAASMIQVKRYQDALDALKAGPAGDTDVQMLTLDGYCKEGLNDLAAAETLAMQALSKDGCYAPALNLKGILSHKKGLLMEAEEYFKKAILQDPSYGEPFTNLGVLKWTAGERDAAFDLMERGFILSPDGEDIADRYHAAATALEAFVRAENLFREAKAIYPSNRHIAFLLIDLLISQDKHAEAMEEIESAMAAFDVDDGFIAAALEVRNILGPLEIKKKVKGETLSLCMIVKNEERNLVRCLSSVKSAVDEIIVVDTGSTDRTKELAAAFGAKVFDFDWDEDFSSARNFSLSRATGDWILVIDADETVSSRDHETIRDFIKKSPAGTGGYYLTTRNYVVETNTAGWVSNDGSYRGEEAGTGWYASRKVRLFRNDPRIRFTGDVHELVEAAMQNAGMKIAECGVPVHHTGKLDRASVLEKGERYYLLGLKKIEESGGTPRAILELAIQAGELGRYDDAIALWRRCLKGSPGQDECRAYVNLINACLNADHFDEALVEARKAAGQANGTRELLLNCAAAEFFAGDLRKAIKMAEKILKKEPDYPPALGLLAISLALAGQEVRSIENLQRLREQGLEPRSQILPAIEKLRKAGKKNEADRLLILLDGQPRVACGPTPPSPDRSRQESSSVSVQR